MLPAGTVTLAGQVATLCSVLGRNTVAPLGGAGPLRLTVPTVEVPAVTHAGETAKEDSVAGVLGVAG